MIFVGLDIETTGLHRNLDHRLIQIGVAFHRMNVYAYDVQPNGSMVLDPEAMKVNGFTEERIQNSFSQKEVDRNLDYILKSKGHDYGQLTAVGWNVGSFDLPFIREELPLTARYFSHRVVDLTAIAIYMARGRDDWREVKKQEHRRIEKVLGQSNWHDAGFDALAGLLQWDYWIQESEVHVGTR